MENTERNEELDQIIGQMNESAKKERRETVLKVATIVLSCVVVGLGVYLYIASKQSKELVSALDREKIELMRQYEDLQAEFEDLNSEYESINLQLDSSREQVAQMIELLDQTNATNRVKIRQYEKELGTLRSIMRNYIVQIDSLNTLNKKLTADADAAKKEAAEAKRKNEELNKKVDTLTGQVATGSVIKGRDIRMEAYNGSEKVTDRSSRVVRLLTSLTLVANDLAPKGYVRVYIRVKDPDGALLTNSKSKEFTCAGQPLIASESREVDYQGVDVDLSIYLNDAGPFTKGIYTVEVYTTQCMLGSAELLLR